MTPEELRRETRSSIELTRNSKGEFLPGPSHPNWKGDAFIGANTGRARAQRMYPDMGLCEDCQQRPARDRDHVDGDTSNNAPDNIRRLCRGCHNRKHGRVPPRPDPAVIAERFRGKTPWNKGLTKATCDRLRGGRKAV